eukprot:6202205-Pleurochrysis_carterae.AAC.1
MTEKRYRASVLSRDETLCRDYAQSRALAEIHERSQHIEHWHLARTLRKLRNEAEALACVGSRLFKAK